MSNFFRIYALIGCIWMVFHFVIYLVCMLTTKRTELGELNDLFERPMYHVIGVLTDGIFWPISITAKLPGILKVVYKNIIKAHKKGAK